MATVIPFKYYDGCRDEYRLPDGRVINASEVRERDRRWKDERDAAKAYDPYNHIGWKL